MSKVPENPSPDKEESQRKESLFGDLSMTLIKFRSLFRKIAEQIGFAKDVKISPQETKLLPSDVMYALKYREAKLGAQEIASLARNNFEREAIYFMLKLESAKPIIPERHQKLVQDLAVIFSKEREDDEVRLLMKAFFDENLSWIRQDASVQGGKVAQLSRQGFELWYDMYKAASERLSNDERETFIIGNATFVGLPDFIREFSKKEKALNLIMPAFIEAADIPSCGYRIFGNHIDVLEKDFSRPKRAVLLDDTRRSGGTMDHLIEFWMQTGGSTKPDAEYLDIVPQ